MLTLWDAMLDRAIDHNIADHDDRSEIQLDVPGYTEEQIEVGAKDRYLVIKGKNESRGDFRRLFRLSSGVDLDGIKASLRHGVLTVSVPKLPEVQPRKITVEGARALTG